MKKWKFLAMALSLSLLFTACSSSKDDKNTSSVNSNGVVEDVVSGVESGVNDVVSGVENGVNDVISGTESAVDDLTDNNSSEVNSENTSKTGDLPAMESL